MQHNKILPSSGPTQKKATKQTQREEIKKLATTTWDKTWSRPNQSTVMHLRRISSKEGTKVGPELYKEVNKHVPVSLFPMPVTDLVRQDYRNNLIFHSNLTPAGSITDIHCDGGFPEAVDTARFGRQVLCRCSNF